jgi:lipopolysaccharide export system protein LptC
MTTRIIAYILSGVIVIGMAYLYVTACMEITKEYDAPIYTRGEIGK